MAGLRMKRRIIQTMSLLGLHASWGPEFKWLCNPVLSCHSCALSWFACPIGVYTQYAGLHLWPWLALGTVILAGVLVGRLLCGWVCPFGFIQDLLYKLPSRKFSLPASTSYIKYGILALLVITLPFWRGGHTMASFCRVCPAATLQVTLPEWVRGGFAALSWASMMRLSVLAIVLALAVFSSRSFCRAFCPIGAILAPFNHISFWKVHAPESCVHCNRCNRACLVNGRPAERIAVGLPANRHQDCIVCHECQSACPDLRKKQKLVVAKEE
jgi:polyferredoxin